MKKRPFNLTCLGQFMTISLLALLALSIAACGEDCDSNDPSCDCESRADGDSDYDLDGEVEAPDTTAVLNEIDCHGRDWVELANGSSELEADLSGWRIADHLTNEGHQYALPEGSIVEPNGYLVVKEERQLDGGELEPGFTFGIKCNSDSIYLLAPNGGISDRTDVGDVPSGSTWGRMPDISGEWRLTIPTQGTPNQAADKK